MTRTSITRRFEFDYGHRIWGHESKCAHVHGHRGRAEITLATPTLDRLDRVIDFGLVKSTMGEWIDENWDHAMLVHESDPLLRWLRKHEQRHYVMPSSRQPTAEAIAHRLHQVATALLHGVSVTRVRFYETPNAWADFTP